MCGRTACTLDPLGVKRACTYRNRAGRRQQPSWRDAPGGRQYFPSHNIAPGSYTPVMLSKEHFKGKGETNLEDSDLEREVTTERVLMPMQWGLVPSWHKGDPKSVMFNMNNCRSDGMLEKKSFKGPLEKGRRCVVLADGFYEWKRDKGEKQPYYIYFPQPSGMITGVKTPNDIKTETGVKCEGANDIKTETGVKCEDANDIKSQTVETGVKCEGANDIKTEEVKPCIEQIKSENKSQNNQSAPSTEKDVKESVTMETGDNNDTENDELGQRLLTMAGVFEIWQPAGNSEPLYSYSIITVDASPAVSWIHHRMPAMLTTDEEIQQWLEFGDVPLKKAVSVIRPVECLQCHPVSTVVNNSRNKTPDCVKPIDLTKKSKPSASSAFMMSWLSKGKKDSPVKQDTSEPPQKKLKMEPV